MNQAQKILWGVCAVFFLVGAAVSARAPAGAGISAVSVILVWILDPTLRTKDADDE